MSITPTASVQSLPAQINCGPNNELLVASGKMYLGPVGAQKALGGFESCVLFNDFLGGGQAYSTTVVDGWRSRKGSDAQCVDWTVTPAIEGTAVGTIGDTTASMAVSGTQLDAGLSWKANQGNLMLEARVKMSQITLISVFIGFTDQTAALEMPIHSAGSADTITTNATDAVGFMFDTSMDTDRWLLVGVANDVDATLQDSGSAPVADTYAVFRIELSTAGVATFYYNGTAVGTTLVGPRATIALTPVIAGFNRDTSNTPTITADYVYVSADRA